MSQNPAPDNGTNRLVIALKDPYHLFTRDQVVYLMAAAGRWAKEAAPGDLTYAFELGRKAAQREVAQLNLAAIQAAYAAPPFTEKQVADSIATKARRDAADATARLPHESDFPGWGAAPEAHEHGAEMLLASWGIDEADR